MALSCDRCERLIQPHETQADIFRWSLVSEAGESFVNMTICRDCAEEIDKAVSKEKVKKKPKKATKKVTKKKPKKKGLFGRRGK